VQTIGQSREGRRLIGGAKTAGVVALMLSGLADPARAQDAPPVEAGHAAAQVGAGILGTTAGFVGGGLATRWAAKGLGASDNSASNIALVGAYTTSGFLTAAGPTLVGPGPHARGSYWAALGGTAVGGLGSILLIQINHAVDLGHIPRIIGGIAVVVLPSIGATIGYNLSRHYVP
jgi:hypothetical protein